MKEQLAVETIRDHLCISFPISGWLYVGAGTGAELAGIGSSEVPCLVAVEAVEHTFFQLRQNFAHHQGRHSRNILIAPTAGPTCFFEASSSRESGLVAPAELRGLWRNLTERARHSIDAKTLETVLKEEAASTSVSFNWLTIDCIPAADLLSGLDVQAEHLDVVECRALVDELPDGSWSPSRAAAIDVLNQKGFVLRAEYAEQHPGVVRLFFVREWRRLYEKGVGTIAQLAEELRLQQAQSAAAQVEMLRKAELTAGEASSAKEKCARLAKDLSVVQAENARLMEQLTAEKDTALSIHNMADSLSRLSEQLVDEAERRAKDIRGVRKVLEERCDAVTQELLNSKKAILEVGNGVGTARDSSLITDIIKKEFGRIKERLDADAERHVKDLVTTRKALERVVRAEISNSTQQIEAHLNIQNYLLHGEHLPPFHGWPVSPDFALFIIDSLVKRNYDLVIEFGSGSSTVLIAKTLARLRRSGRPPAAQITFEHSEVYCHQTADELEQSQLSEHVSLVHAPLVPYAAADGEVYQYYDCTRALSNYQSSVKPEGMSVLVIVDGPPAATGKHARYPAVPVILDIFKDVEVDVLLDDYSRDDEKEVAEKWMEDIQNHGRQAEIVDLDLEKKACFIRARRG